MALFGKKKGSPNEDHFDADGFDPDEDRYDTDELPIVTADSAYYPETAAPAAVFDDAEFDDFDDDDYADDEFVDDEFAYDENVDGVGSAADDPKVGPFDYNDVADLLDAVADQRLNLGSVILPMPPGGQLQVEMTPDGTPQAVHLATEHGRITVAAYAAPKSPGQWRAVTADLAESLRKDGGRVAVETGPWGRELLALTDGADLRFIGIDGYRWMVRLVAAGPSGAADEGSPLVAAARAILRETVIRRGSDPLPVRDPLPVVLPPELAEQLAAAHQQQVDAAQAAQAQQVPSAGPTTAGVVPRQQLPEGPRRDAGGSAMQQLGHH